jgi:hypothetical protein
MPYKDPEQARAYKKAYDKAQRAWAAAHPDEKSLACGKRQDIYFEIETEQGLVLHKRCSACRDIQPVTAFSRAGATWKPRCKLCLAPADHALRMTEKYKERKRERDKGRPRNGPRPRSRRPAQDCVYIVQLIARCNTVKIGCTKRIRVRLSRLKQHYGELRLLCVIPTECPRDLEQQLHTQFKRFRLYEDAKQSELFSVSTKAAQNAFRALLAQYAADVQALPSWESMPQRRESDRGQLVLW